jgi:branched-chain amino acid transport system ATP-binding protein
VYRVLLFDRHSVVHARDEPLDAVVALGWNHVKEVPALERGDHVGGVELPVGEDAPYRQPTTVIDNLRMSGWRLDADFEERVGEVYDQFPILAERSEQVAGTLSGGQRRMLAVAPAIMYDADFLMLDEPSAGLAPQLVTDMFDHLLEITDEGTGVLLVEQNADEALRVADRAMILEGGRIKTEAAADELEDSEEIAEIYMGSE